MSPFIIAEIVVGSVCVTMAVVHLVIYFRRPSLKAYLFFALMALCVAANALSEIGVYRAFTIDAFTAAFKVTITIQAVVWISLIWFIVHYTGTSRRSLAMIATAGYAVAALINVLSPYGILYSTIEQISAVTLPWGERIAFASGPANPWRFLADGAWLVLLYLSAESCVRLYRHGATQRAVFLGASLLVFLGFSYLHGTLIDLAVFAPPSWLSISFFGLIIIMSISLADEVARASGLSRQISVNERRWQSLLENVELAIVEVDARGRIVQINPYAERITGYRMDQLAGRPVVDLIPRRVAEELEQRFEQAIRTGPRAKSIWPILCASGEERLFSWSSIRHVTQQGVPVLLSVGADITERHQAERALQEERERMSIVLATLNTGLVLMDRELTVTWANPLIRSMFPGEHLEGRKCYAVAEKRTAPCEGCQAVLALSDGRAHEREFKNIHNKRWFHVVALPIKDGSGAVIGVLEATTDVNERKVMEEALRESEEKFREFFRSTPDYCFITSPEGTIIDVNDAVVRRLGYRREGLLGRPLVSIYAPESAARLNDLLLRHTQNRQIMNEQAVIIAGNGERRTVLISAGIVRHQDGTVLFTTSVQTDITKLKQTMEAHDRTLAELRILKEKLEEENIYLREEIEVDRGFAEIIGTSNALLYVITKVEQVAKTDASVLIEGETGVGKELIARAVHRASARAGRPFIKVDCTALPASLVESELFGHERGAFTGADRLRKGRFELADGGTIFLDEVSELPLELQSRLLRVVQDRQFERVGSSRIMNVDVRVITATNRNLSDEVAAGRFRADLFYRLNVYPVTMPPLRTRREDIPLLVRHYVPRIASRVGKRIDEVPAYVMDRLTAYDWPGNVRELINTLERAVITSPDPVLRLSMELRSTKEAPTAVQRHNGSPTLEELERQHIVSTLKATGWRISGANGAAEILGINPSTLRFRIKKLNIQRDA